MKQWNDLIPMHAFSSALRSVLQTISIICEYENTKTRCLQQKDSGYMMKGIETYEKKKISMENSIPYTGYSFRTGYDLSVSMDDHEFF